MEVGTDDRIITLLAGTTDPLSLAEISTQIARSPPATHRQLQLLAARGIVERRGSHKDARYSLAASVEIAWTVPARGSEHGFAHRWRHPGEMDWRFPLVSRLNDVPAQWALTRFLEAARDMGLFTPWLVDHIDDKKRGSNDVWADLSPRTRRERRRAPTNHGDVHMYAYGSCVTGAAHVGSDLDLVVVYDLPKNDVPAFPYEREIEAIVKPLNLGSARRLDVRVFGEDAFFVGLVAMHERVRRSILDSAITVFSTATQPRYIERSRTGLGKAISEWMNPKN